MQPVGHPLGHRLEVADRWAERESLEGVLAQHDVEALVAQFVRVAGVEPELHGKAAVLSAQPPPRVLDAGLARVHTQDPAGAAARRLQAQDAQSASDVQDGLRAQVEPVGTGGRRRSPRVPGGPMVRCPLASRGSPHESGRPVAGSSYPPPTTDSTWLVRPSPLIAVQAGPAVRGTRLRSYDGPVACVLGDMDLVRPLALANIPCVVVGEPGSGTRYSRATIGCLPWVDHWSEQEAMIDGLLTFGRAQAAPPVLFYEGTADALAIARHRSSLEKVFRFVAADAELVEDLTDKARFHDLAARLELPVPATRRLDPVAGSDPQHLDLQPPVLFKPVIRQYEQWSQISSDAKAVVAQTQDELAAIWPRLASAGVSLLAQEMVAGEESAIESYHVYVGTDSAILAEFTGKKIRTRPARFGFSTAVTITDAADVRAIGREVVGRLGLTGVAKVDFKRSPEGRLYLLEINPRFTLWHHPAALAGLNVPALVWSDLTGAPRPKAGPARPGVRWCDLWDDAAAAKEVGELGLGWLRWAASCEAKSGFARDDPMPFIRAEALPRIGKHLRRVPSRLMAVARSRLGGAER
jgi:D-aspartate ligase